MSGHVAPAAVLALKARLRPAFAELARRGRRGPEAEALEGAWRVYEQAPVDWLDAPRELERGRDLEARLAWLQGPGASVATPRTNTGPTRVGEFLGMHTVRELRDFLAAKAKERDETSRQGAAALPAWQKTDAPAAAAWASDLAAANAAFDHAASAAQLTIDLVPDALAGVTPIPEPPGMGASVWQGVLEASKPYPDLQARLRAAGAVLEPYKVPQPTAADPDLEAYKAADTSVRAVEDVAKATVSVALPVLAVGGLVLIALAVRR